MSQQLPPDRPTGAEHLEGPAGWERPAPDEGGSGRRRGLLLGGGVLAAALVGGGVWAWSAYFEQGAQPAETLPADTLAYAAIDLDPTGQQKLEAIRMLKKFPAIEEELDLELDDDLRRTVFESIQADGTCADLDYAEDIEPWLGNRAAVAAVPGADKPDVVAVLQVTDQDGAEAGLEALAACGTNEGGAMPDDGAAVSYAFNGEWVVLAETEEIATATAESARESTLADDGDYQSWTDAAGDPGVVTVYAAPDAGEVLAELMSAEGFEDELADPEVQRAFAEFPGLAGTLRFDDGAVEFEVATGQVSEELSPLVASEGAGDVVESLPASTAVALGVALRDGWAQAMLEQLRPAIERDSGTSLEEALAEAEQETGLALPEDLETLLGDSVALAVDGSLDPRAIFSGQVDSLPIGARISGDADQIEAILAKLRAQLGPEAGMLLSRPGDGHVVVGVSEGYLDQLAGDGGLGDEAAYQKVVEGAEDAAAVMFVSFDAGDWLTRLAEFDTSGEAKANLAPLEAFGVSSWSEDDELHALVRLTTED